MCLLHSWKQHRVRFLWFSVQAYTVNLLVFLNTAHFRLLGLFQKRHTLALKLVETFIY